MHTASYALRTGTAFAVTAGVAYAVCTLVFWLFPEASATFMSALFHGLDFRKLQAGETLFSFAGSVYALAVLVAWAFALGTLFGWIRCDLDHVDLGQVPLARERQAIRR